MRKYLFIALIILSVPIMAQDGGGLEIGGILSIVFGLLMTIFGSIAKVLKSKSAKLANFSRESMEALMASNVLVQHHVKAIEDDKLTKEELLGYAEKAKIVAKETGEAIHAFRVIFKRDPDPVP